LYKKPDDQLSIDDFMLPFEGKLRADNRWVQMAKFIPWNKIENDYAKLFPVFSDEPGAPAAVSFCPFIKERTFKISGFMG